MKKHVFLILALLIGLFMRGYQYKERFMYNHDNDLSAWIVKDIVINNHLRLIGQQTSAPGIFIGPLYYYSLIPFYVFKGLDPLGTVFHSLLVSSISIFSIYYVFYKLHGRPSAIIAALIYAASFSFALNERDVVPTTPVFLWTVWFYYAIQQLFQGKKPLILIAFLFSLVWHLHLALALLAPLVLLGILFHIKKYQLKDFIKPVAVVLGMSLPLFIFEFRHNFIQLNALVGSLTGMQGKSGDLLQKISHVILYASRNVSSLFYWDLFPGLSVYVLPAILLAVLGYLILKGVFSKYNLLLFPLWMVLFIIFFSAHPINLSEYYLNGLNILWVAIVSTFFGHLIKLNPIAKGVVVLAISFIVYHNLQVLIISPINHSGYLARTELVNYIKHDAGKHGFPCISVSYMTDPGYNLGYRYLFWHAGLHVNQPKSGSPVYTIVFPHPRANHLDATFGALGLITPNYAQYQDEEVITSCSGADANQTDPMFGFTD